MTIIKLLTTKIIDKIVFEFGYKSHLLVSPTIESLFGSLSSVNAKPLSVDEMGELTEKMFD